MTDYGGLLVAVPSSISSRRIVRWRGNGVRFGIGVVGLVLLSTSLGCLPLPRWIVWGVARLDLAKLGTGNFSVSAAFRQAGVKAGVAVVLGEIGRGVLPVAIAQLSLPDIPAAPLLALLGLAISRFCFARGGSVTNCAWGMLFVAPSVVVGSAVVGGLGWLLGKLGLRLWRSPIQMGRSPIQKIRGNGSNLNGAWVSVWAARAGCGSGIVWMAMVAQTGLEVIAAIALAGWLLMVNLWQGNDATALRSLAGPLRPRRDGAKAARLSVMHQAGIPVPMGWVVLPHQQDWQVIARVVQPSSAQPVIARSSAVGEDGVASSAAGQYRSSGVIEADEGLRRGIEDCRASYEEEGAIAYRQRQGVAQGEMAVLVQRYVTGKVSGVAFSRHPLDGAPVCVVEALAGGAESGGGGAIARRSIWRLIGVGSPS